MTRSLWLAVLSWIAACGGGGAPTREWTPADHGQPRVEPGPEGDRAAPPASTEDPSDRAARALWNATCASCHGRDGRGHGEGSPPGAKIPDFTLAAWQASRSDEQLAQVIRDGRNMMPSFGKQVNPQGIAVLVQHVRGLRATKPSEPTPTPHSAPDDPAPTN